MDDPDGGPALDCDADHGGDVLPQVLGVLLSGIQWVNPYCNLLRRDVVSVEIVNLKQRGFLVFRLGLENILLTSGLLVSSFGTELRSTVFSPCSSLITLMSGKAFLIP